MEHKIRDTGITIGYEPRDQDPAVDIVFIHGLQGHPYRTWRSVPPGSVRQAQLEDSNHASKNPLRRAVSRLSGKSSRSDTPQPGAESQPNRQTCDRTARSSSVFWPTDLLPVECPKARVLLYGYDTNVTKFATGAPNKNTIFSHSKDFLFALDREHQTDRPLIFVAHSLGGILVKEMLSASSTSPDPRLSNIVESTAAVIFLGTPHRGSPGLSSLAEWAQLAAGAFMIDTSAGVLDSLGLKNADLERAQESFSGVWRRYDFRIKTFQEGLGLTGLRFGIIGHKVVPDHSSLIGDERERAETINANHMGMCRYTGQDDPNYCKVAGELRSAYLYIIARNLETTHRYRPSQSDKLMAPTASSANVSARFRDSLSAEQRACLQFLWFPSMNDRHHDLNMPAKDTCLWLFKNDEYRNWVLGDHRSNNGGLIWLRGKPGSGKSVLMKEAFRRAALSQDESNYCTAAFFFNAKGVKLSHSPLGLLRSLLYQLLPSHPAYFSEWCKTWSERRIVWDNGGEENLQLQERELREAVRLMLCRKGAKRTIIFLDAMDECDEDRMRDEVYFWEDITLRAYKTDIPVDVCLSSRHFPTIGILYNPIIVMEDSNNADIHRYVRQRLGLRIPTGENKSKLRSAIVRKSEGVFLWVVLVVDDILRQWDEGRGINFLLGHLDNVPVKLEELFNQILSFPSQEETELAIRLFQWAILTTKPLCLKEWHHVIAFIRRPVPSSLREWGASEYFTEDDDQLEKQIRKASRGLVEVRTRARGAADDAIETISVRAGAGSLSLDTGETRAVQVIHESVRGFFLTKDILSKRSSFETNFEGSGHVMIMTACLDYLDIPELDALVHARLEVERHHDLSRPDERSSSRSGSLSKSSDTVENLTSNQQRAGLAVGSSVFEALRSSSDPTPLADLIRWLGDSQVGLSAPPRSASPCSSIGQSQTLEAYPALLSYATSRLFTHAQQAERNGADASSIIERLSQPIAWNRWVVLREDIPPGTTLLQYATYQGLHSWAERLRSSGPPQPLVVRRRRKLGSVASFSSASSHTGSCSSNLAELPSV